MVQSPNPENVNTVHGSSYLIRDYKPDIFPASPFLCQQKKGGKKKNLCNIPSYFLVHFRRFNIFLICSDLALGSNDVFFSIVIYSNAFNYRIKHRMILVVIRCWLLKTLHRCCTEPVRDAAVLLYAVQSPAVKLLRIIHADIRKR